MTGILLCVELTAFHEHLVAYILLIVDAGTRHRQVHLQMHTVAVDAQRAAVVITSAASLVAAEAAFHATESLVDGTGGDLGSAITSSISGAF